MGKTVGRVIIEKGRVRHNATMAEALSDEAVHAKRSASNPTAVSHRPERAPVRDRRAGSASQTYPTCPDRLR